MNAESEAAVARITLPFTRDAVGGHAHESLWRERSETLRLLYGIMGIAEDALHRLDWIHLNKDAGESEAVAPLRKLHAAFAKLFPPTGGEK